MKYLQIIYRITLIFILINFQILAQKVIKFQTVTQYKIYLQNRIQYFTSFISKIYSQRCVNQQIKSCNQKSVDTCLGTHQQTCVTTFPKFLHCTQPGARLSLHSGIRLVTFRKQQQLSSQQKIFICATATIEQQFQKLYFSIGLIVPSFYFGTSQGSMKFFPSFAQYNQNHECGSYDPRVRPWYNDALSTSKNIIIALPTSGFVSSLSNLNRLKKAAQIILQTLTKNDFFNVLLYNDTTYFLDPNASSLIRGNSQNRQHFIKLVNQIQNVGGNVNFKQIFEKSLSIFKQVISQSLGAACPMPQNIILLFADGPDQQHNFTALKQTIDTNKINLSLSILTYQLPTTYQSSLSQILINFSCEYDGIFTKLNSDSSKFVQQLKSFFTFISQGLNQKDIKPTWSQPYTDFSGGGRIVTVVYPGYYIQYKNGIKIRKLLGVAGFDLRLNQISKLFPQLTQKFIQQIFFGTTCVNLNIFRQQPCKVQIIRPQYGKCSKFGFQKYKNCTTPPSIQSCTIDPGISIFTQPTDYNYDVCCSPSNVGTIIGGVIGGVVGCVIIAIVGFCIYRKFRKNQESFNENDPRMTMNEGIAGTDSERRFRFPKDGDILTTSQRQKVIDLKFSS